MCVWLGVDQQMSRASFSPQLAEYTQWENQLKKTLADLEKREKQLAANEHEVRVTVSNSWDCVPMNMRYKSDTAGTVCQ